MKQEPIQEVSRCEIQHRKATVRRRLRARLEKESREGKSAGGEPTDRHKQFFDSLLRRLLLLLTHYSPSFLTGAKDFHTQDSPSPAQ